MSAFAISTQHRKPVEPMSKDELENELAFWSDELASLDRWGEPTAPAIEAMSDVVDEITKRRVAAVRLGKVARINLVVDHHTSRAGTIPDLEPIILMGAGKTRAEWKPPRIVVIAATAFLVVLLAGAVAVAGQRLAELDERFASELV